MRAHCLNCPKNSRFLLHSRTCSRSSSRKDRAEMTTRRTRIALAAISGLVAIVLPRVAHAQDVTGFASQPVVSLVALGALTLLPFLFMTATCFGKISIVFSILRNALG